MSIDAFIAAQPEPARSLLTACRDHLHDTAPGLREALKWGVPTFMLARNLFYLNPKGDHVVLGFVNGAHMVEFRGVFDKVQSEVAHVIVRTPADLQRRGLREAVRAAAGFPVDADFGAKLQERLAAPAQPPSDSDDALLA